MNYVESDPEKVQNLQPINEGVEVPRNCVVAMDGAIVPDMLIASDKIDVATSLAGELPPELISKMLGE